LPGIGLVTFFSVLSSPHIRARVFYNIAFPGLYLLLARNVNSKWPQGDDASWLHGVGSVTVS
jgi:hypothetical protein